MFASFAFITLARLKAAGVARVKVARVKVARVQRGYPLRRGLSAISGRLF